MKKTIVLWPLLLVLLIGCSSTTTDSNREIEVIIDATQFARISVEELTNILGEPQKVEEYKWIKSSNNEKIEGSLYIYENNKFEFLVTDDSVVRLNVYSGEYWGYDDSVMSFKKKDDIFNMFGIVPSERLKKVADTNSALRYSPVSDKVADVWIEDINKNNFGVAKITYNLNYF